MQENELTVDLDPTVNDLGPLAWVLDELRKSLDGAIKALRRFVRDADMALGSDLASLDNSHLRIARQQLHQAQGALEMVGQGAAAGVLRAMESVTQRFVQRPELCTQDQAHKVELASFALLEYLETLLRSRPVSPVVLFPQYRDLLEIVGEERVHPADLWPVPWRWVELPLDSLGSSTKPIDVEVSRQRLDKAILKLVKNGQPASARSLARLSLELAAGAEDAKRRSFWVLGAAYFEALAEGWCANDLYAKRTSSRVLTQFIALIRGDAHQMDRLAQDLLFFCAQAAHAMTGEAPPALRAVIAGYGLTVGGRPIDYEARAFGRYDPAVLVQARKRISVAKETWAALSGGDAHKLKAAADQFLLVSESLLKLDPNNGELAHALNRAMDATLRSGHAPSPQLALEVATSVLFLEAAYDEIDPEDGQLGHRADRLAERLNLVLGGGAPQPLETWMEELYRRVSERQTMGSVVSELGVTISQLEKAMDQYFRDPSDKTVLQSVPGLLAQTRGVLSLLGMDQASTAVQFMRSRVEQMLFESGAQVNAETFEQLGNSLGALGFMVDMLSYQPTLAKKMFIFDQDTGEFRSVMGRKASEVAAPAAAPPVVPAPAAPIAEPAAVTANQTGAEEDEDAELRGIFVEEAREVLQSGLNTIGQLARSPSDIGLQTTLRRSFHTLKGSSRMVGLDHYGEAAWAMEQLLNGWIAEQKPVSDELRLVAFEGLHGLQTWLEDIAQGRDTPWKSAVFRTMADALRVDGRREPLQRCDGLANPEEDFSSAAYGEPPVSALASFEPDPVSTAPSAQALVEEHPVEALLDPVPEFDLPAIAGKEEFALVPEAAAAEVSAALEFADIDFAALNAVASQNEATPEVELAAPQDDAPALVPTAALDLDLDLTLDDAAPAEMVAEPMAEPEAAPELSLDHLDFDIGAATEEENSEPEEEVKVIGDLRISIPLYNVYLNEADEWSRRLATELGEWALELPQPVSDSTVALAHSLAGSSATVGFSELSSLARDLEHALEHVHLLGKATAAHGELFCAVAQDIRRLLHQFAAGFIKEADAQLVADLRRLCDTEVVEFAESTGPGSLPVPQSEWIEPEPEPEPEPEAQEAPALPEQEHHAQPSAALLTPVLSATDGSDDEFDVTDAIDVDLFPIFEDEAQGLLPSLSAALRQWAGRPDNLGARNEVLRSLHTLKGSARLAGAMRLGEMAHRFESSVESLGSESLQASQIEPLLHRFDLLQEVFAALCRADAEASALPLAQPEGPALQGGPAATVPLVALDASSASGTVLGGVVRPSAATALAPAPARVSVLQSVRVRPQLLDRLVNQAGEVMMTRSRLESGLNQLGGSLGELTGNLERLRAQLRDIELQAETQMQSRLAQSKDTAAGFDPLEFDRFTRVQELTRMMAESVNDVATVQRNLQRAVEVTEDSLVAQARQTRDLQRDLLRTRMVEFENIAERLYGVVRQAAKDTGKQVRLDIVAGSIELDRSVLDRMTSAFEHLLRNCVGHGIEAPTVRTAAGKEATGTVTISLSQEGNDVAVEFVDDGAGLDLQRIKDKAVAQGLMKADEVLSLERAAELIFAPGFSTAEHITELSGRGIGMDVVRAEVSALGGRIETHSESGVGTRFKLVLPLTTAVTQVVIVRAGNLIVGVPSSLVETVRRVKLAVLEKSYQDGVYEDGQTNVPFYWAGALLQSSARSHEMEAKTLSVVIFRSAGQRVAVHVDEVLGNQEVVVKNLGPQLARLPGLAAMTVLASGAVVLIYNPVALATVYGEQARLRSLADAAIDPGTGPAADDAAKVTEGVVQAKLPLILVVDDSITVRRVTQRLLLREGYRVALAVDGLQALESLQEEIPAVVLTDIEMPRMDGFDLARNIRGDVRMKDLPIVMITSRIADKHREHAAELGVNHYLGKPYSEEELLSLVHGYCVAEQAL